MKAYTLKRKKGSAELHLFEGEFKGTSCSSNHYSVCGRMAKTEGEATSLFMCETEETARKQCWLLGRAVCGTCIGVLYGNFD